MDTTPNQVETPRSREARRAGHRESMDVPSITPASAARSPQLQVSDADVVRELVHHGR